MILMLFWISRFSCSSARAPGANPRVYPVARVVRVMCVIIFRAPERRRRSGAAVCSAPGQFASRSSRSTPVMAIPRMLFMGAEGGARRARPRAARCASQPAAPGRPPGFFGGGPNFFPIRFRNFSKGSLEFFQNQFSGAEWARGVGHLEDSEIRNFSNVSLEFFQTHFGIFPKGARNFSNEISEFVQRGPGFFQEDFGHLFPWYLEIRRDSRRRTTGGPAAIPSSRFASRGGQQLPSDPLGATLRKYLISDQRRQAQHTIPDTECIPKGGHWNFRNSRNITIAKSINTSFAS